MWKLWTVKSRGSLLFINSTAISTSYMSHEILWQVTEMEYRSQICTGDYSYNSLHMYGQQTREAVLFGKLIGAH